MNSHFQLLEHRELVLARDNAKSARIFSFWAIGIAFASLAASLYFSNQPIQITDTQYRGIVKQFEIQSEKLDALIERAEKIKSGLPQSQNK